MPASPRWQRSTCRDLLGSTMGRDHFRLKQQLNRLEKPAKITDPASLESARDAWLAKAVESSQLRDLRASRVPEPSYDASLPVVAAREKIIAAIHDHPVVILCGETGSGKTTQLPKMCLEAGRGVAGFIGHTQPRRIAARSVAARIAEELGTTVGEGVGFKIRFSDQVADVSHIKLMTDGILLAEIQQDPYLNQYDTIIVDEAHERSLNIDFLLGCLKRLLSRRRDLKVIITSATIDPDSFSRYFDNAPVLLAEGRSYPVELRYLPPVDESAENSARTNEETDEFDGNLLARSIIPACETLLAERAGDVLVFLSGEREIREMADALKKHAQRSKSLRGAEILPLFARLSNAEQNRIFQSHQRPRIILSTNVAETSLTVPGIRSVIDSGVARISRYSVRGKMQQLPIEKISRASADQRKGRCGREAPGICIRLYEEEDFEQRAEFTEPEILRTNLASVILQMMSMRLGRIEDFPLIDPPESKFVNDGYRTLQELGALDSTRKLRDIGKRLARLPIDPRLARMLIEADREGCVDAVLTIVAALSVQDPRDRPFDHRQLADELHAEFNHERSDFLSWLALWQFVQVQKKSLSNSKFRKMCKQRFLSPIRLFEWMEVRRQLMTLCRSMKLRVGQGDDGLGLIAAPTRVESDKKNTALDASKEIAKETAQKTDDTAQYDRIHRALLSGLLVNVAVKTEAHEYLGTRNRRLQIFPGSALFKQAKKSPKWIMAAEISQTTRVFARQVASIDPEWVERAAAHLLQKSYRDPHWQKNNGHVGAFEQSTLYGLIVNAKKRVNYSPINPEESRNLFIRDALVQGLIKTRGKFLQHNLDLIDEIGQLEDKSRRRDLLVDPQELERFYDSVIPEDVNSTSSFETWRKSFESDHPRGLFYTRDLVLAGEEETVSLDEFPEALDFGAVALPLSYHFSPGAEDDGVTLNVPVNLLNRVDGHRCDWLVPGMLEEKLVALIKSLPKALRRNFVPAPDYAKACLEAFDSGDAENSNPSQGLLAVLGQTLQRLGGCDIPLSAWELESLPKHLHMNFRVVGENGKLLSQGRDLNELQKSFTGQLEEQLLSFHDVSFERDDVREWNFGDLPESVEVENNGVKMRGHPALQLVSSSTDDSRIALKLFASPQRAELEMRDGLIGLYKEVLREEIKYLSRKLPGIDTLSLRFTPFGTKAQLIDDIINAAISYTFVDSLPFPRQREQFLQQISDNRQSLVPTAGEICNHLEQMFEQYRQVSRRIDGNLPLSWVEAVADVRDQIAALIFPGFVSLTGLQRLARLQVYFKAMDRRLDGIDQAPDKDRRRRAEFLPVWEQFKSLPDMQNDAPDYALEHNRIRWSLEELRISLFAQDLGTAEKVSVPRMEKRIQKLSVQLD